MKNIKKIFTAALLTMAAFGFFGCADSEEDEELTVDFNVTGSTEKTVKMTASSTNSEGHKVFVIYTLDGSEPKAEMISGYDKTQFAADVLAAEKANASDADRQKILTYIDCGTADVIESGKSITVSTSTTITAKAFYIVAADIKPLKTGPKATKEVTITVADSSKPTDSDANATGDLTFKIAKTGNSYTIHYFDTSDKTFEYTYGGTKYDHCYYQMSFSYKGAGKGIWYLYVRQIGKSAPIGYKSDDGKVSTNFLAQGVYESACFDSASKEATNGELTLKTKKGNTFGTANINNNAFEISINSDTANSTGNVAQAIADAK